MTFIRNREPAIRGLVLLLVTSGPDEKARLMKDGKWSNYNGHASTHETDSSITNMEAPHNQLQLQPGILRNGQPYKDYFVPSVGLGSGLAFVPCNIDGARICCHTSTSFVSLRACFKNMYKTSLCECSTQHRIVTYYLRIALRT